MSDAPWLLGVEIGGTKLQLGMSRRPGSIELLKRSVIDPSRGAEGIRGQIREAFEAMARELGLAPGDVRAAGVGFGGPVDAETGRTQASFQVEGWSDFPLADWMRETLGVARATIQNDADTAGLAESRLGAGRGRSPLLYLTIGSGIGGALIVDGRIYRGAGRGAVEIGHLRVPTEGAGPGEDLPELEQVASGWGIGRLARRAAELCRESGEAWSVLEAAGRPEAITAVQIAEAAGTGDAISLAVLGRAREALAFALAQAIALVAPARIILGGGVSLIGEELWFRPLRDRVDAMAFGPFRGSYDIVPAALGEEVVVHGALELAGDLLS